MKKPPMSRIFKIGFAFLALAPLAAATSSGATWAQTVGTGETLTCKPSIPVSPKIPQPKGDGSTGGVNLCDAAQYAWQTMIALNWAADAKTRNDPDVGKHFGVGSPTVWETHRSKVEVYPGLGSGNIPPHGVELKDGKPVNEQDFYGYDQSPKYVYSKEVGASDGLVPACKGQEPVKKAAWVVLDETTQIGNNQTYAGALGANKPTDVNSSPNLIRYGVKINRNIYTKVVKGQYWYNATTGSTLPPINLAKNQYVKQLEQDRSKDPNDPYVDLAPAPGSQDGSKTSDDTSITVKTAWRPLTDAESKSGRFVKSQVRYYEQNEKGDPCYREAEWGLVGMHLITFTQLAPWVIWSTFEQADNILTADGKPTEDENGAPLVKISDPPTSPALQSDPNQANPTVVKTGDYCKNPGKRLYFRENPAYGTMPSDGDICVNARWHAIPDQIVQINKAAHDSIQADQKKTGAPASPWLYYKLVNAQGTPVDYDGRFNQRFSSEASYYLANSVIETDYSLGKFTGDLVNGVPANLKETTGANGQKQVSEYYNTRLLPFQEGTAKNILSNEMRMGGCGGCHAFAATKGTDFSFALLGGNVKKPEPVNAFGKRSSEAETAPAAPQAPEFRNYKVE